MPLVWSWVLMNWSLSSIQETLDAYAYNDISDTALSSISCGEGRLLITMPPLTVTSCIKPGSYEEYFNWEWRNSLMLLWHTLELCILMYHDIWSHSSKQIMHVVFSPVSDRQHSHVFYLFNKIRPTSLHFELKQPTQLSQMATHPRSGCVWGFCVSKKKLFFLCYCCQVLSLGGKAALFV